MVPPMSGSEQSATRRTRRLFNEPIEYGFRTLFVLNASKASADLHRLVAYDYLLVHSGDVSEDVPSLHPAVPFRGTEWLVKREFMLAGLDLMYSRQLLERQSTKHGFFFIGTRMTAAFIDLLSTDYASSLKVRARWVSKHFGDMSDENLHAFMTRNVGRWGAEFERLSALRDLDLQ
jgi:hypothetical protein